MRADRSLPAIMVVATVFATGCGRIDNRPREAGDDWRFTRRSEGDVTTTITHSGSRWEGAPIFVDDEDFGLFHGSVDTPSIGGLFCEHRRW